MTTTAPRPAAYGLAPDDQALFQRLSKGDERALDALMRAHWSGLVAYAATMLGSFDGAEDVAQLTFVRVWQRHGALQARGSAKALLYRVARNLALDEQRRREVRTRWADRIRRRRRKPETPLDVLLGDELERASRAALDALPARRREAFVLCRFHDMSYGEAAQVLGVSPQTIANQVSAALAQLRDRLRPYLGG